MSGAMELLRQVVASRHEPEVLANLVVSDAPIIGYLDSGFPEELAIAAGFRPMLLTGDVTASTPDVDDFLDLAVPGRVRALLAGMLMDSYGTLASVGVTGGDSWLEGVQHFLQAHEVLTGRRVYPDVAYIQRVRGRYRHHRQYILNELVEYRAHLEELAGSPVTDDAISAAISEVNTTRALIREISALRHQPSPAIGGVDAQTIVLASMIMPKAQFNSVARELLDSGLEGVVAPKPESARLYISGTALDHTGLHELVESVGAVVVGEDHEFGERYATVVVDESLAPLEALADRIALGYPEPWSLGRGQRIAMHVQSARAAEPDAQVYFHVKGDQGVGWDFPDQRRALEPEIPVLPLIDQGYTLPDSEAILAAVEEFVAKVARRDAA